MRTVAPARTARCRRMLHASDSSSGCGANNNRREPEVKAGTSTAKSLAEAEPNAMRESPINLAAKGSISLGGNSDPLLGPRAQRVVFWKTFAQKCERPARESAHRCMASRPTFPSPGHRVRQSCKALELQLRMCSACRRLQRVSRTFQPPSNRYRQG